MSEYKPHDYQRLATEHILNNEDVIICQGAGLFLEMGLGKTVSTLTALDELKYKRGEISKILVIAPKRVAEHTWPAEVKKWDHLRHLKVAVAIGSEQERVSALMSRADIYTINRENVPWLIAKFQQRWMWDVVVVDESSSFKNPASKRFKALRMVRPKLRRFIALTGTPAPNNLLDLWPQVYLIDRGERLERTLGAYRQKYFNEGKRSGHQVFTYDLKKGDNAEGDDINKAVIYDKISDVCISMKAKDWLQMPERIDSYIRIEMPPSIMSAYEDFEEEMFMTIEDGTDITALNAASLTGKLLQFANGAIYDRNRDVKLLHDLKLDALDEYIEAQQGNPVLLFYNFRHDVDRIMKRFKSMKPRLINGPKDIDDWNAGRIPLLIAHPASAGHGLNMQDGGCRSLWYGLLWSLELYQQACARLHRQGQRNIVLNTHIICNRTIEDDVLSALAKKARGQDALMDALRVRAEKYRKKR